MAHQPKPFYRSARNAFYVQLGKQQIKLVAGPEDAATEKLAWATFHKLMAERVGNDNTPTQFPANPPQTVTLTVGQVFEKYLGWCEQHRSARTYEWTRKHIQCFCDRLQVARTGGAATNVVSAGFAPAYP